MALQALDTAFKGKDPTEKIKAFYDLLTRFKDAVTAYADGIALHFPDLAPQAQAMKAAALAPAPGEDGLSSMDVKEVASLIAEYIKALPDRIFPALDAAELEIISQRKKYAKTNAPSDKAHTFSVRTGAPVQAAIRALADCTITKSGNPLNIQIERDTYEPKAFHLAKHHHLGHQVIFKPSHNETIDELLKLGGSTAAFVFIYVEELIRLAAAAGRSENRRMTPWVMVDISDVVKKTMGEIKNKDDFQRAKQKVWDALRLVDNTYIQGERNWNYSRNVETKIASKIFAMGSQERPGDWTPDRWSEPPLRVGMTVTPEWLTQMKTGAISEYLPFVEILGAIPGGKVGGAWARCLGLAWVYHSRRYAAQPDRYPTRRELLDSPLCDVSPYFEVLESPNPLRAIEYFKTAEEKLVEAGFLLPFPETRKEKTFSGYNWGKDWLDEEMADWKPGHRMEEALKEVNSNRPAPALMNADRNPTKKAAQGKKRK
jgi:hypothetical protein